MQSGQRGPDECDLGAGVASQPCSVLRSACCLPIHQAVVPRMMLRECMQPGLQLLPSERLAHPTLVGRLHGHRNRLPCKRGNRKTAVLH